MTEFKDRLHVLMKGHNMTQQQLADKLHIKRGSVSNWVTGRRFPDKDLMIDMAEIFNVSLEHLYGSEKENKVDEAYKLFNQLDAEDKQLILSLVNSMIEKNSIKKRTT